MSSNVYIKYVLILLDHTYLPCKLKILGSILYNAVQIHYRSHDSVPFLLRDKLLFSCSMVSDPATPWTAACQATLFFTMSQSVLKIMSIELVMPSNHLILCHPLHLPSDFLSIRVFFNESAFHIRWPKDWSFSFSISPSNECSDWLLLGLIILISLLSKGLSRVCSNTTVQKLQFFGAQPSLWSNSHIQTWLLEKP